jgi:predicted kinase
MAATSAQHQAAPRYALFITGPPASGKSSVAESLARALPNFALLQKDTLKESLYESLHEDGADLAITTSRQLSDAATRMLWAIAPNCPRIILETNFRTLDPQERDRFHSLDANKLEVHCHCRPEVAMRRFAARALGRHPAHTLTELSQKVYQESQSPFDLAPLIQLDTTTPVDISQLLQQIHAHWPDL